jgi:hypothetical protein
VLEGQDHLALPFHFSELCYLLCISGLDDTENREIYETYMHSDQIAYTGKITQHCGNNFLIDQTLFIWVKIVLKRVYDFPLSPDLILHCISSNDSGSQSDF